MGLLSGVGATVCAYSCAVTDALGPHRRTPVGAEGGARRRARRARRSSSTATATRRSGSSCSARARAALDRPAAAAASCALPWDSEVSRAHALLEQVGGAWTIEDRGSSNGTLVNTARISGPHVLRDGDVVRIGRRRSSSMRPGRRRLRRTTPAIDRVGAGPTDSQRKVLVELCRPALERGGGAASNREIAEALFVSVETVKTHMRALFDAFGVGDVPQYHKRTELVRQGARDRASSRSTTSIASSYDLSPSD